MISFVIGLVFFVFCTCLPGSTQAALPPSITLQPASGVANVIQGESLTLPCAAQGVPPPTIEWHKDGVYVYNSDHSIYNGGNLTLPYGSMLDTGHYQCRAENNYGVAVSDVVYAREVVLGTFQYLTEVTDKIVNEGDFLLLQCNPPKSVPGAVYKWKLQRSEDEDGEKPQIVTTDKRVNVDQLGNLLISHAVPSDAQTGFFYACHAENRILLQSVGGSRHRVTVTPRSAVADAAPILRFATPGPVTGLTSTNVILQCLFSGFPTPTVSWRKRAGTLPGQGRSTYLHHGTQLMITDLRASDEGVYVCNAGNRAGSSDDVEIRVDVKAIPRLRQTLGNTNYTVDDEAVLECTGDGDPTPHTTWYMNGIQLNGDAMPARMVLTDGGSKLKIRKVCKLCDRRTSGRDSDLMVIQCNYTNQYGHHYSQGYINVLNRTQIIVLPPETRVLQPHEDTVHLECAARTDTGTQLTMRWYKGEDPIQSLGDTRIAISSDHTLSINMTGLSLSEKAAYIDTYTCEAGNGYSTDTATTYLDVEGAPDHGGWVGTAGFEWWWIIVVILFMLFMLIILLCCCLCAQRNKGDVYDVDKMEKKNGNQPERDCEKSRFKEYRRPDKEPIKGSRASLASSVPLDSLGGDSDSGQFGDEYGDIDTGRFNEDGSFIGQYTTKSNANGPPGQKKKVHV